MHASNMVSETGAPAAHPLEAQARPVTYPSATCASNDRDSTRVRGQTQRGPLHLGKDATEASHSTWQYERWRCCWSVGDGECQGGVGDGATESTGDKTQRPHTIPDSMSGGGVVDRWVVGSVR
eukprot:11627071-Alexandrium_andersonii.AAC.1